MRSKKARLRSRADKLWKIAILNKWGKICYCGTKASSPHHFYPKGLYGHLRYDLNNGCPLCIGHHFSHHTRGDPSVHEAIIRERGKNWLKKLKKKAYTRPKPSFKTIKYYKDTIEKLKQNPS